MMTALMMKQGHIPGGRHAPAAPSFLRHTASLRPNVLSRQPTPGSIGHSRLSLLRTADPAAAPAHPAAEGGLASSIVSSVLSRIEGTDSGDNMTAAQKAEVDELVGDPKRCIVVHISPTYTGLLDSDFPPICTRAASAAGGDWRCQGGWRRGHVCMQPLGIRRSLISPIAGQSRGPALGRVGSPPMTSHTIIFCGFKMTAGPSPA